MALLGLADWYLVVVALPAGSFLGVVIERLPQDGAPPTGRSHCTHCGVGLGARDLVPLASWLAARGRCRHCGAWLGWFYPGVELAALTIAVLSLAVDRGADAWIDAMLGWWLLALGWIDWRHAVLPDILTLPLIPLGLALAATLQPAALWDPLLGAAGGYLSLRLVGWVYRRRRGRDGLGRGDAKLLAAGGAWVGLTGLPSVVAGAAIAGLCAAGAMMLAGHRLDRHSALPFGPFLAAATWLVWLFGPAGF
ncbi:MAG TPA: A24 family peptidase [Stellaceae bacterium]|nr:A24 family peptidase [Stellaceae bacterium]